MKLFIKEMGASVKARIGWEARVNDAKNIHTWCATSFVNELFYSHRHDI